MCTITGNNYLQFSFGFSEDKPPIVTSLPFFLRMKARENCFHSALLYTEPKPSCCLFSPVSWVLGVVHSIIHSLADMHSCSQRIGNSWSSFCFRRQYCWASSLTVFWSCWICCIIILASGPELTWGWDCHWPGPDMVRRWHQTSGTTLSPALGQ